MDPKPAVKIEVVPMQAALSQLTERTLKAHGADLVSLVLYGSAAAGEHDKSFSDINILCVLREVTPAQLEASEPVFRWWREQDHPPPLLLSQQEVRDSTDCFAIEFHDMKQQHRILHGADVISGLEVDNSFYRAQVERELRAKVLRLRTKAAGALSSQELLVRLLAESISTFCVLLRHALLLHGVHAPPQKRLVIEQCQSTFGITPEPFLQILDIREEKVPLKKLDAVPVLGSYLKELATVIDAVDRLNK